MTVNKNIVGCLRFGLYDLRKVMIMSKWFKRFFNATLIITLVFAFNIIAFAQGTTKISVSKSSAAVGDTITVSVSGTEKGTITVKYTSSMLNLSSCSVSGYTTEGNSVSFSGTSGDLVFKAASEGTASIIVSSSANSGSSTTLAIGASASATTETNAEVAPSAQTEEQTEAESTETDTTETDESTVNETPASTAGNSQSVGTLNSDGGFDIDGVAYVVSERYADSEIPSGFSKTTITIGSSTYSELSNGTITLLYLKPADNTAGSGVFYLYNAEAGTVSPFLMLGSAKNYVIISNPDSTLSSAFSETSLDVTGGTATAYTIDGSEFFYVYGVNQDGASGWYLYDKTYKTVSRVDEAAFSTSSSDVAASDEAVNNSSDSSDLYIEKLNLYRKIIMGLIILCVVLLFIIINKAIKGHGEDDDDFDGDVFASAPKKSGKRMPRSIVFGNRDSDEDEEDFEDEDDYEEDEEYYDEDDEYEHEPETSRVRYESESYDARRASSLNMMDLNDL